MMRLAYIALFLVGLTAIVYAVISAAGGKPPENRLERYAVGEIAKLSVSRSGTAAPDSPFYLADGSPVTLADFRGKTLLVNFWATWCGPCRQFTPELVTFYQKINEKKKRKDKDRKALEIVWVSRCKDWER